MAYGYNTQEDINKMLESGDWYINPRDLLGDFNWDINKGFDIYSAILPELGDMGQVQSLSQLKSSGYTGYYSPVGSRIKELMSSGSGYDVGRRFKESGLLEDLFGQDFEKYFSSTKPVVDAAQSAWGILTGGEGGTLLNKYGLDSENDPDVEAARQAIARINKDYYGLIDKMGKAVGETSVANIGPASGYAFPSAEETYGTDVLKGNPLYSAGWYGANTPQSLADIKNILSTPNNEDLALFQRINTKYNPPYEQHKYDWYEPESWFPKVVIAAITAATAGGATGAIGGAGGAGAGGGGASIGGTGASAGGWAEAIAPYTGMTGATGASTAAAPWWSTLGTTLGTQGGNMAGLDWATLTGQGGGLDLTNIFSDIYSPEGLPPTGWGGGGGMDWLGNLIKGATGTGGEGGWKTTGQVLGKILGQQGGGGGGGGGGQPTGTQQSDDWVTNLLNLLFGGGNNQGGGLLGTAATAWGGYEQGQESQRQRDWLERLYAPQQEYQQEQLGLFKDVFSPMTKSLGGELGKEFSLEDVGEAYFGKGRNRLEDYFKDIEQRSSEVFAGSGMLGQGPANKYFTEELPAMKAKSMEELAVDEVLFKEGLKQQNVANQLSFLGRSPSVAGYGTPAYTSTNINWGNLLKDIVSPAKSPIAIG